jgi:hypothetical protein
MVVSEYQLTKRAKCEFKKSFCASLDFGLITLVILFRESTLSATILIIALTLGFIAFIPAV